MLRFIPLVAMACSSTPDVEVLGYRTLPLDEAVVSLPVERGAPPEVLGLSGSDFVYEGDVTVLTADAEAGDSVSFVYSTSGPGVTCPAVLMGSCVDLARPRYLATAVADDAGVARLDVPVRCGLAPVTVWIQAVYIGADEVVVSDEVLAVDILPSDDCGLRADRLMFDLYVGVQDDALSIATLGLEHYAPSLNVRLGNEAWLDDMSAGIDDPSNYCSMYWRLDGSPRTDWADDMWVGWDLDLQEPWTDCSLVPGTLRDDPFGFIESGEWRLAYGEVSAETADWLAAFASPDERDRIIGAKVDTGPLYGEHWDYTYASVYPVDSEMVVDDALLPFLNDEVATASGVTDGWYLTYSAVVLALP